MTKMSTMDDKEVHSRSSLDTHVPDLEKGEIRPEREEEDTLAENVCFVPLDMHYRQTVLYRWPH